MLAKAIANHEACRSWNVGSVSRVTHAHFHKAIAGAPDGGVGPGISPKIAPGAEGTARGGRDAPFKLYLSDANKNDMVAYLKEL